MDSIKAYFDDQVEQDNNIVASGVDQNGNVVVFVLNDEPEVLSIHTFRFTGVQYIKTSGFFAYDIPTGRFRPAPGGVTGASSHITGGTIACAVRDKRDGSLGVLSCSHVFCPNLNGPKGEPIVQPSPIHGGAIGNDLIARLERWQNLKASGVIKVDAAYAKAVNQTLEQDISLNVLNIGYVHGISGPYPGEFIYKMGARTSESKGWITLTNVKAKISYGPGTDITLEDLFVSTAFSAPGDSGSLMLDFGSNAAVGVLFAGDGMYTLGCTMSNVEQILEVEPYLPPEQMRWKFLDVSKWQESINPQKMLEMGISGLMMKCTQGASHKDPKFHEFYDLATQYDMLRGAYIYVESRYSAQEHYDNFLEHLGGRELNVPIALDCEDRAGQSVQTVTAVIQGLSNRIMEYQNGQRPMIYTSPGFWNSNVLEWSEWKNHPLWIANWTQFGLTPLLPRDWNSLEQVALWQYFVEENGAALGVGSQKVDVNRGYRLLGKLISGETPPPPPDKARLTVTVVGRGVVSPSGGEYEIGSEVQLTATPDDGWEFSGWSGDVSSSEPTITVVLDTNKTVVATFVDVSPGPAEFVHYKGVTTVSGLRIRSAPGTTNSIVGSLPLGATVEILETTNVGSDVWVRIGYKQWSAEVYRGQVFIKRVF